MVIFPLLAAAAAATPATVPMTEEEAIRAAKPDRVICKIEKFVGSHFSQKVCKTKLEWEGGTQNAQDALNHMSLIRPAERSSGEALPGPPSRIPR